MPQPPEVWAVLLANHWQRRKLTAFIADDALPFTVGDVRIEETPTNTVIITREP